MIQVSEFYPFNPVPIDHEFKYDIKDLTIHGVIARPLFPMTHDGLEKMYSVTSEISDNHLPGFIHICDISLVNQQTKRKKANKKLNSKFLFVIFNKMTDKDLELIYIYIYIYISTPNPCQSSLSIYMCVCVCVLVLPNKVNL